MLHFSRVEDLHLDDIEPLVVESLAEGYGFVVRLRDEWIAGSNRFDRPGEVLLLASDGGSTAAVCGLNVDPYIKAHGVGRLRHLFVSSRVRRSGVGRELVSQICQVAVPTFERVRLRVGDSESNAFYAKLGFEAVAGDAYCTHQKSLSGSCP